MPDPFAIDNVDRFKKPTASQAAGLTRNVARTVVGAALDAGRDMGVAFSCAVVDSGGLLVAFERMDAAELVTIDLAIDKAFTAVTNQVPTADLAAQSQPGAELYGYANVAGGRMVIFGGGLPLFRNGVLVGGVGVSGGTVAEDQRTAEAGVAAFEKPTPSAS
jgi:uncharacterized protein GlcG (DUF336 family)